MKFQRAPVYVGLTFMTAIASAVIQHTNWDVDAQIFTTSLVLMAGCFLVFVAAEFEGEAT